MYLSAYLSRARGHVLVLAAFALLLPVWGAEPAPGPAGKKTLAAAGRAGFFLPDEAFDRLGQSAGGRQAQGLALFDAVLCWTAMRPVAEPPASARGRKLLLVTLKVSPNPKPEERAAVARTNAAMLQHLESLGFAVTVADEAEPASRAEGQDLVVIMATIRANRTPGRYRHVIVPVVNLENDILDDVRMTAKRRQVDFGELEQQSAVELVNAPHPLAAGLTSFCLTFVVPCFYL